MRPNIANLALVALTLLLGLLIAGAIATKNGTKSVPYSEFKALVSTDKVDEVTFSGQSIVGKLKEPIEGAEQVTAMSIPEDDSLVRMLQEKQIAYGAVAEAGCSDGAMFGMAALFALSLWMFMGRQGQGGNGPGIATFGRSSARLAPVEGTGVTFKDVAGIDEAKEDLDEIVQFLKTPERFTRLGGKIPKGVLLIGPPGTGKTLLARAVAGEAGVPFFSISGSDFVEMFVGVGAARVRDLFKQATERAPCIIFIDEIDAVGKARGSGGPVGGHDEREQTLNQLLVEMDGFDGRKGIIIMAATNRPETLDQALLRAGRFDRQVVVDPPDVRGREAILLVHARGMRLDPNVDMREVAQRTSGFTGADLANALNEAALLAARRSKDMITFSEIDEAVERLSLGVERKSRRISDEERKMTAYHEAGHALCAAASEHSFPVQKISIIPRGMTGGVTRFTPPEGRIGATRSELLARLTMGLGGLAAEAEFMGDVTTGAKSDIAMCSATARSMITEYGMSERLGAVHYGSDRPNPFGGASRDVVISDVTAREIDAEVRRMIDEAHERAQSIMRQNRDLMAEMATYLMEHEAMDGDTLKDFTGRVRKLTLVPHQTTG